MATRVVYDPRTGRKRRKTVSAKRSRAAKRGARKRLRSATARRNLKRGLARTRRTGRTKSGRRSRLGRAVGGGPTAGKHTRIKKGYGASLVSPRMHY